MTSSIIVDVAGIEPYRVFHDPTGKIRIVQRWDLPFGPYRIIAAP